MADAVFGFTRKDAEALLRLIGGETDSTARTTDTYDATACYLGVATTAISAYAAGTLGSGTAQFKAIDTANTLSNTWTGTVYNYGSAIASGARIIIWRVGDKHVAVEVC
jgi:hypothetical protein